MLREIDQIESLLDAEHPCLLIETFEEEDALAAVRHVAVHKGLALWLWSAASGLRDGLMAGSTPLADTLHPAGALLRFAEQERSVGVFLDLGAHLRDERTRRVLRETIDEAGRKRGAVVLIDEGGDLPAVIRAHATPVELTLPDEHELEQLVRSTLRRRNEQLRITVELTRQALATVVRNLRGLTRRQARQLIVDAVAEDRRFDAQDVNHVLAGKRRLLQGSGLLEFVESPVTLDEVGGLRRLKAWLESRRLALGEEAKKYGLPAPRGVLLLGVQGAGKSLAAKATATAWQLPLMRLDVGALYDKYIGESERQLRESLRQAESMAPMVLWIDEIEKAFASAASRSSDGGLSQRMFGALLTWMQERAAGAFLVATANDIEALPPELMRKGRFDEIFFVDLPTPDARALIAQVHLRKRGRDPAGFDLAALAEASEGFSGAEIEQAVVSGMSQSFAGGREVRTEDILAALRTSPPLSVTMRERIESLRDWAKGRCVPAD